jgi:DNA-binding SARP family transcriptional activator
MRRLNWLGPVALVRGGGALALPVRKAQALLLLLAREGAVPRVRATSLLWPALPEATARRNLRRELARLRESRLGELIAAGDDRLELGSGVADDATAFEAALAAGAAEAAIAMWRAGEAAAGLELDDAPEFAEWLAAQRARLLALRVQARAAAADAAQGRGDLNAARAHLDAALADDPLHEALHRQAMALEVIAGRREAALARYERCRALLAAELGLEPLEPTRALAAAIRRGDGLPPAPADGREGPPAAASGQPPGPPVGWPAELPFVGRTHDAEALADAWSAGRAVWLEGEGGVGKSRFAREFCAARGAFFAAVRCRPADQTLPYAAFTRGLRVLAGGGAGIGAGAGAAAFAALPGWVRSEVARLVPEAAGDTPSPPPPIEGDIGRARFVEAAVEAWRRLADTDFDAVILDDWHHADAASAALLLHAATRRTAAGPGGARPGAREWLLVRPDAAIAPGAVPAAGWVDGAGAARHRLEPWSASDIGALTAALAGAPAPSRVVARLHAATGGQPFFVAESLRRLVDEGLVCIDAAGAWSWGHAEDPAANDAPWPLPHSVREAIEAQVARLPEAARRLLDVAALADEPFAPALLGPACALTELEAAAALDAAVAAGLLRLMPRSAAEAAGGFGFVHDLQPQAIAAGLAPARRALVHRRLALAGVAAGAPPARVARHFAAAGDAPRAALAHLEAAAAAGALHARADAIRHRSLALELGATSLPAEVQLRAHAERLMDGLAQGDATSLHDDRLAALRAFATRRALPAAERFDVHATAAEALCGLRRGAEALAELDRAPAPADEARRHRAERLRITALIEDGRPEAAEARLDALSAASADAARGGPPPAVERDLLRLRLRLLANLGRFDEALPVAERLEPLLIALGDEAGAAEMPSWRGALCVTLGRHEEARRELEDAVARLTAQRAWSRRAQALVNLCMLYGETGQPEQALAAVAAIEAEGPPLHDRATILTVALAAAGAAAALGDAGAWLERARRAVATAEALAVPQAAASAVLTLLDVLALFGEHAAARRLAALAGEDIVQRHPSIGAPCEAARALHAAEQGDLDAARRSLARLHGADPRHGFAAAPMALAAATLALAEGRPADATQALHAPAPEAMNHDLHGHALAIEVQARVAGLGAPAAEAAPAPAAARAAAGGESRAGHGPAAQRAPDPSAAPAAAALAQTLAAAARWLGESRHPSIAALRLRRALAHAAGVPAAAGSVRAACGDARGEGLAALHAMLATLAPEDTPAATALRAWYEAGAGG